jgi:hypothetical protein
LANSLVGFIKGLLIQNDSDRTKQVSLEAADAATTGTKTVIQATQTANRTLTLPDATSTIVGDTATQTLQNKTLDNTNTVTVKDSLLTLQDNADTTKQAKFEAASISPGTTRTLTLPDASTTLMGTDTVQNVSWKVLDNTNSLTVKDTNLIIQDDGDTTKQAKFQASGIASGQTRTLTIPDADLTIVGTTTTQTLTNKTLTSPVINSPTGIVKGDVGLGNVDNTSDATKNAASVTLQNKTLDNTNAITVKDANLTIQDDGDTTKQMKLQLSGITSGQTRTFTVPDASTTLVGADATQTLQNKTLDNTTALTIKDSNFTIQDDGDTTKQAKIQASGITSGQTRTYTLPDASTTLDGIDTTATLTNKTMSGSSNTFTNIPAATAISGLLGITNGGTGQSTANAALNALLPTQSGNSNKVLKTDGSTTSWTTVSGGGSKNYLSNITTTNGTNAISGDFEDGTVTGWSKANVPLVGGLPFYNITPGLAITSGKYVFQVTSANATVGATYTNNGQTFTVVSTIAGGTTLTCTGTGSPASSGNLTKTSGTGDNPISFSSWFLTTGPGATTVSAVSSSQIAGSYSLSHALSGLSSIGEMLVSDAFNIDNEDKSKILNWKFAYQVQSGAANITMAGTSSNSWQVWIYDVTAGSWIQPTGVYSMTQKSGVGLASGTFQTTATSTQYQLVIYAMNNTAGAATIYYDDFSVSPVGAAADGRVVEVQLSCTSTATIASATNQQLTGFTVVSDSTASFSSNAFTVPISGYYRIKFNWYCNGVAVAGVGTMQSVVRVNNVATDNNFNSAGGTASQTRAGFYDGILKLNAGDAVTFWIYQDTGTTLTLNGSGGMGASIQRLAGPTSGDEGRVIISSALASTTTSVPTGTNTKVNFASSLIDNTGSYSTANSRFTAPISGFYKISTLLVTAASQAFGTNTLFSAWVYKNGSSFQQISWNVGNGTYQFGTSGSAVIQLNAGDYVEIWAFQNAAGTITLAGSVSLFNVERVSGPNAVSAQETVAASYSYSSTQSFANNTTVTMTPDSKVFDTHNAYSTGTGLLTVPISGKYRVTAFTNMTGLTASNGTMILAVIKNGSIGLRMARTAISIDTNQGVNGSIIVTANAGDTLGATLFQSNGATRTNETGIGWVQFERVGN